MSQSVQRYMVFFNDKAGTPHSLSDPRTYLSSRALERRTRNHVCITEQDLPVSPPYVAGVRALGVETYYTTRWMNGLLVQCTVEQTMAINALPYVRTVDFIGPGRRLGPYVSHTLPTPTPTEEPGYFATRPENERQLSMLGLLTMHEEGYLGEGVLIAILDGGFQHVATNPAFAHLFAERRILYTHDYVRNVGDVFRHITHGTAVLSCLAGYRRDAYAGAAYRSSFALFVTEDGSTEYKIEEYNMLLAMERADSLGADIISASLGYRSFTDQTMNYTAADLDGETAIASRAAKWAVQRGMMVVTSAGNSGRRTTNRWITPPCDADSILCVGSVDSNQQRSPSSSVGPAVGHRTKPDVAAMGVGTRVMESSTGEITVRNGTSYATPLISGLVACFMQRYPNKTMKEIRKDILLASHQAENPDNLLGYGIPHYLRHRNLPIPTPTAVPAASGRGYSLSIYPNPVFQLGVADKRLHIKCTAVQDYSHVDFLLYRLDGILQKYVRAPSEAHNTFKLHVDDIPPGVYVLKVRLLSKQGSVAGQAGSATQAPQPSLVVVHEYEAVRVVVQ